MNPRHLLLLAVLAHAGALDASTWHVSNAGSDAAAGTAEAPLATLSAAHARSRAGDTILLERGGLFREYGLTIWSGCTAGAYGDPARPLPVLCGSVVVGGWAPVAGSATLVQAPLPVTVVMNEPMVFVNGERMTLARHPDSGWLRTANGTDSYRIVDPMLKLIPGAAPGRWAGAQVRWRKWSWWYETRPITADDGVSELALGGSSFSTNLTGIDSGYYIDNHRAALDAPGEWYWDKDAGKLILYPPAGADWRTMQVEVALRPVGLTLAGATLRDIHIRHYTDKGVVISGPSTVEGCLIEHVWDSGIRGDPGAGGSLLRGNTIRDILNVGISWYELQEGSGGTVIERNLLQRCGIVPGLGGSGSWHAAGVILYRAPFGEAGVHFRFNRIEDTGYAGVVLGRPGQTIERNVIRRAMRTLNDGGGIYANASYNFLRENIILDTEGDLESSHPWTGISHGIWVEYLSNFHSSQIFGNTVYGSGGDGLYLPNNFTCVIQENTFLSNMRSGIGLGNHEAKRSDATPNQDHLIVDNLIGIGAVPWAPLRYRNISSDGYRNDVCLTFKTYTDRQLDFGTMGGTTFLTLDGKDLVKTYDYAIYFTIPEWQASQPQWADPAPLNVQGAGYLFINDTDAPVRFPLPAGIAWTSLDGAPAGPLADIPPYRSVVLLSGAGIVPGLPGYQLHSELDPYAAWAAQHGLSGAAAAPAADPDGDGCANVLEFLFDVSPASAAHQPQQTLAQQGPLFASRMRVRRAHPGWILVAEVSADLRQWSPVAVQDDGADTDPAMARRRVTIDPAAAPFLRLRVAPAGQ